MNIRRIQELAQQAKQKMTVGDFESAKNLAYEIQKLGSHFYISYIVSGLLVDIGNALRNEQIIFDAVKLLEKDFEESGPYYELQLTQNALFYRIIYVRRTQKTEDEENREKRHQQSGNHENPSVPHT